MTVRRGTCPGLADPMPTGDGLLARFAIARPVSLEAFAALCTAARRHGNGMIEITSRGSVQIRGLTAKSAPAFAAAVGTLDIADPAGGRVLTNPLAGLDPHEIFDVTGVAAQLRAHLVESGLVARLAPKVSIVVDAGGGIHLDAIPCDVRLRAVTTGNGCALHVTLAGDGTHETTLGTVAPEQAIETALALLRDIAARGPTARARDLPPRSRSADVVNPKRPRAPAQPIGSHALRDGALALGIGFPFGHSDAGTLQRLIDDARRAGAVSARPAPGRVLLLIGVAPTKVPGLIAKAEQLGFITEPDDPRRRIVACAGAPACSAAEINTRALAPAIAAAAWLDKQIIHVSGCSKGCAHPERADLTIVGVGGKCGIVPNGRAQDAPVEVVTADHLPAYLTRHAPVRETAHG
jgi:precorrin-3B synthase